MTFALGDRVHILNQADFQPDGTLSVYVVQGIDGDRARVSKEVGDPNFCSSVKLEELCPVGQAPEIRVEIEPEASDPFTPAIIDAPLMTELRTLATAVAESMPMIAGPPRVLGFRHVGKPERSWIPALVATGHIEVSKRFGTVTGATWESLFELIPSTVELASTLKTLEDAVVLRVLEHRVLVGRHAVAGWVAFGSKIPYVRTRKPGAKLDPVRGVKETSLSTILFWRMREIAEAADSDVLTEQLAFGATRIDALDRVLRMIGLAPSLEPQLGPAHERLDALHALLTRLYQPRVVFPPRSGGHDVVTWGGAGTETYLLLELHVNGLDPLAAPKAAGQGNLDQTKAAAQAWLKRGWNSEEPAGPGNRGLKGVDLPAGILEAMKGWRWLRSDDTASAVAYRINGAPAFFMIVITTDADDRYVEFYDVEGRPCGGVVCSDGIKEVWTDDVAVVRKAVKDLFS